MKVTIRRILCLSLCIFYILFCGSNISFANPALSYAQSAKSYFDDAETYARRAQNASDVSDFNYNIRKAYRSAVDAYDYSNKCQYYASQIGCSSAASYALSAASAADYIISYIKRVNSASSLEEAQDYARKAKNEASDGQSYISQAETELISYDEDDE